jgi:hypothetical protein
MARSLSENPKEKMVENAITAVSAVIGSNAAFIGIGGIAELESDARYLTTTGRGLTSK